ncbi:MAG: CHASE domain-containing protein [Planctomycetes bacterium]|nr:CHASE domain-containing protein [Planctomycetota bacterium]
MTLPGSTPLEGEPSPRNDWWRSRFPSISIGLLGSLAALVAFLHIHESEADSDSLRFQRLAERVASRVTEITRRYEYGLKGGRGLYAAAGHVSAHEWQRYVASHGLASEFPGALGFGVIQRVPRSELQRFTDDMRAQGLSEYRVNTTGDAPEVLPVTYIEPLERNIGALGQDIALRPEEREAAQLAMLSGRPTLSAPIRHLQEGDQWGFMYFVPCYAQDAPISTEEERRQALVCWIYAPIVIDRLLAGIATRLEYQVDFEIFDEDWSEARTPLFDWDGDLQGGAPVYALERRPDRRFLSTRQLEVGQRHWTLCVSTLPAFSAHTQEWMPWFVLEGGVLASLLLSLFVRWQNTQRTRAEELVTARTRELREQNRSLEAARASADAATRAKSEFLANMSHEIRTPMTAILGFAELMRDPRCTSRERGEYLSTIHSNGNHLLSLINDILDLSKIEAGQMTVERIPCSPVKIVDEVAELLAQRARSKDVQLRLLWPDLVPESIQTDPVRARQVLVNLVSNALKFTERGEVRIESSFEESKTEGSFWVCRVHDTGIGMDERQLDQVFEPFTQADSSTTRKFGGSGLGLPISRRLAELLGGELRAHCVLGKGCTFEARISTGSLEGVARVAVAEREAQERTPAALPSPRLCGRVLVVEDGADNRTLVKQHLERAGLSCSFACNGREALEAVAASEREGKPFELIVMDMLMPQMDGYEATIELRRRGSTLPILALSANVMSGDRERCLRAGCDEYAGKPIDSRALCELCASLIGRHHAPAS